MAKYGAQISFVPELVTFLGSDHQIKRHRAGVSVRKPHSEFYYSSSYQAKPVY